MSGKGHKLTAEEITNRQNGARNLKWNHFIKLGGVRQSKAWWAEILADLSCKPYRTMYNTLNSYSNRPGYYASDWDVVLCASFGSSIVKHMTKEKVSEAKKQVLDVAKEKVKVSKAGKLKQ